MISGTANARQITYTTGKTLPAATYAKQMLTRNRTAGRTKSKQHLCFAAHVVRWKFPTMTQGKAKMTISTVQYASKSIVTAREERLIMTHTKSAGSVDGIFIKENTMTFYCTFNYDSGLAHVALKFENMTENAVRNYMASMFQKTWGGIYPASSFKLKEGIQILSPNLKGGKWGNYETAKS